MARSKVAPNESAAINPTTGEVLTRYPHQTHDQVQSLLDQSVAAFRIWRDVEPIDRAVFFDRLVDILRARMDEFAITMTREMGKARHPGEGRNREMRQFVRMGGRPRRSTA